MNHEKIKASFAAKLHALREEIGLTADALGKRVGVDGSSISNWERCKFVMSRQSYDALIGEFPQLQDDAYEGAILIETKPGGRPRGSNGASRRNGKRSAPAFPAVRTRSEDYTIDPPTIVPISANLAMDLIGVLSGPDRDALVASMREAGIPDDLIVERVIALIKERCGATDADVLRLLLASL